MGNESSGDREIERRNISLRLRALTESSAPLRSWCRSRSGLGRLKKLARGIFVGSMVEERGACLETNKGREPTLRDLTVSTVLPHTAGVPTMKLKRNEPT